MLKMIMLIFCHCHKCLQIKMKWLNHIAVDFIMFCKQIIYNISVKSVYEDGCHFENITLTKATKDLLVIQNYPAEDILSVVRGTLPIMLIATCTLSLFPLLIYRKGILRKNLDPLGILSKRS